MLIIFGDVLRQSSGVIWYTPLAGFHLLVHQKKLFFLSSSVTRTSVVDCPQTIHTTKRHFLLETVFPFLISSQLQDLPWNRETCQL